MLSRAGILSGQQTKALTALALRSTSTTPVKLAQLDDDKLNKRPVRQEPGKVRLGFIPDEWFTMFYKKTGVTGPYVFGAGLTTYLVSKEIYVLEHEYYSGLSLLILCVLAVKKLGPGISKYLDKQIDEYESAFNQSRVNQKNVLQEQIDDELKNQHSSEGQTMLVQAKRDNVGLQLEAAYRQRLLTAYREVKRRLDYQVEKQEVEARITQQHIVDWVVRKVTSSITPDQDKQNIDKCIADLGVMAKAAK